jgi:hypothetical protein
MTAAYDLRPTIAKVNGHTGRICAAAGSRSAVQRTDTGGRRDLRSTLTQTFGCWWLAAAGSL